MAAFSFSWTHLLCLVLLLASFHSIAFSLQLASAQQQHERPQFSGSGSFFSWRTARSLLHSLLHRIINHRLARGDAAGAERVRRMIASVDSGIWFWKNAGSLGWDYLINYSWRRLDASQLVGVLMLINDLQSAVGELSQFSSDLDRLHWISANYGRILQLAKSALQKLLKLFDRPGAIQSFVFAIEREVMSGDILRDALQLGASDFQGLIVVAKEMLQRYYKPSNTGFEQEL